MTAERSEARRAFVPRVLSRAMRDRRLTHGQRSVLTYLAMQYGDGNGDGIRPGKSRVAAELGTSVKIVRESRNRLVEVGYLVDETPREVRERQARTHEPNWYRLGLPSDTPPGVSEDPQAGGRSGTQAGVSKDPPTDPETDPETDPTSRAPSAPDAKPPDENPGDGWVNVPKAADRVARECGLTGREEGHLAREITELVKEGRDAEWPADAVPRALTLLLDRGVPPEYVPYRLPTAVNEIINEPSQRASDDTLSHGERGEDAAYPPWSPTRSNGARVVNGRPLSPWATLHDDDPDEIRRRLIAEEDDHAW